MKEKIINKRSSWETSGEMTELDKRCTNVEKINCQHCRKHWEGSGRQTANQDSPLVLKPSFSDLSDTWAQFHCPSPFLSTAMSATFDSHGQFSYKFTNASGFLFFGQFSSSCTAIWQSWTWSLQLFHSPFTFPCKPHHAYIRWFFELCTNTSFLSCWSNCDKE